MNRMIAAAAMVALALPALAQAPDDKPVVAPTTGNPNLAVATVKLENGARMSKIIGSTVYNDKAESVGTVDDLIMTPDNRVVMAVVAVGGIAGIGSKLVAVPFEQLTHGADGKTVVAGATKDSFNAMPNFTYN